MKTTIFNSIIELITTFDTEQKCIDFLEKQRWNGKVVSPYDSNSKVYKCSNNLYKCKNTRRLFNVRTNTLFEGSNISLRTWFLAIYLIASHKKGISSCQLAKDLHVTQKTGWFILQRIRKCFNFENKTVLSNEVEIDEVYLGGVSSKSKGQPGGQGRSTKYKTPVLGMVERGGKLNAIKVPNTKGSTIIPNVVKYIKDAIVYTDEWVGYKNVKDLFEHYIIKHGENEYVRGKVYTNTIEGFWSLLKRGFIETYQYISKKHLQLYVDEFVFRYNTKMISEYDRFIHLLSNMCVRTRYNDLKIA